MLFQHKHTDLKCAKYISRLRSGETKPTTSTPRVAEDPVGCWQQASTSWVHQRSNQGGKHISIFQNNSIHARPQFVNTVFTTSELKMADDNNTQLDLDRQANHTFERDIVQSERLILVADEQALAGSCTAEGDTGMRDGGAALTELAYAGALVERPVGASTVLFHLLAKGWKEPGVFSDVQVRAREQLKQWTSIRMLLIIREVLEVSMPPLLLYTWKLDCYSGLLFRGTCCG